MTFKKPNYTQVPNDLFSIIPDMGEAELKVTLVIVRETFGFHRDKVRMSLTKLQEKTGMSRQGVLNGIKAGTTRKTIERFKSGRVTEYGLMVNGVDQKSLPSRPPSIKESIKESAEKVPFSVRQPGVALLREFMMPRPGKPQYYAIEKAVRMVAARLGGKVTRKDLEPFYQAWVKKGWNPKDLTWLDWAVTGKIEYKNGRKAKVEANQRPLSENDKTAIEAIRKQRASVQNL